ncbi:hypothetical protein [Kitasatospora sp. NPDC094011]|uniref:hypothetical protein n=1 Tax=Kitasatospora sp. NPDC094011 TaxID=3364090 RepID=UPI00382AF04C
MSTESWPADLRGRGDGDVEAAEASVSWELGELADSVEAGPVPYQRLLDGGRRRLRRRRLLTAVAGAVLVVAIGGAGATLGGGHGPGAGGPSMVAAATPPAPAVKVPARPTPPASPSATATPSILTASSGPVRDPFTPVRVKVRAGTMKGHALEAWVALWPAATTAADGARQADLIWQERRAVDPTLTPDSLRGVPGWDPRMDRVDVYLVSDGKRQPDDYVEPVAAPGRATTAAPGSNPGGALLQRLVGTASSPEMMVAPAGPEVARVVVDWRAGGSSEAVPVTVGDSPVRWWAVVRAPGSMNDTLTVYAADGSVLRKDTSWW